MISKTYPAYDALICDQALVPALNSITSKQADTVAEIARASEQDWNVQAGDDYDGYRFVLIETAMRGDKQKSFFVGGTAQHLELFESNDESLALVGTFTDMKAFEVCLVGLFGRSNTQCAQG